VDLSIRRRLELTVADVDARRLQERFSRIDVSPIADVPERCPVRFGGEVRHQHRRPADSGRPLLSVAISDGSGTAQIIFTGRSRIHGLDVGRIVLVEGVARRQDGQLVTMNPAYTLLP
jgi:hypothetical protein